MSFRTSNLTVRSYPIFKVLVGLVVLVGMIGVSRYNFLLFHAIAELFSIAVALSVFLLVLSTRKYVQNISLVFLGVALLFIGLIDLAHMFVFKGMDLIQGISSSNQATQFWVAARTIEAASFLLFSMNLKRKLHFWFLFTMFSLITLVVMASIFWWQIFPDCYVEPHGLTPFKRIAEYVISIMLFGSILLLYKNRSAFDAEVYRLITIALVLAIVSELMFTFYGNVNDLFSIIGHYLKIFSFLLIYLALVRASLVRPYSTLFVDFKNEFSELNKSASLLRQIADNYPNSFLSIINRDYSIAFASGEEFRHLSQSSSEFTGKRIDDIFGDKTHIVRENYQKAFEGEEVEFEVYFNERHYAHRAVPLRTEGETIDRILVVVENITQRKLEEEAIKSSELRYRQMFETNQAIKLIIDPVDGKIVQANQAACRFYGYPEEELLSKSIADINNLPRNEVIKLMNSAKELESQNFQFQHKLSSGEIRDVEVFSGPLHIEGKTYLYTIVHDISKRKEAEMVLRERELFLENVSDIAYMTDMEGNLTYVNPAAERITGFKIEEIVGKPFLPLFVPSDHDSLIEVYKKTLTGESMDNVLTFVNGVTCEFSSLPRYDADGTMVGTFGIGRDITESLRVKRELAESERKYSSLVSQSPIAYEVYNSEGIQIAANAAYEKLYGIKAEDTVGKFNVRTDPQVEAIGNKQYIDRAYAGESVKLPEFKWDPGKSGYEGRSRWLSTRIYPLLNEQGEVINIVITHEDFTDRKEAERALQASAEEHRTILQTAIDGFWQADLEGNLLEVNEAYCQMSGFSEDELLSMNISDIDVYEDSSQMVDHIRSLQKDGSQRFESKHHRKDGSIYDVQISAQYHTESGDKVVVFIQDITQRKKNEADLAESEARLQTAQKVAKIGNWEFNIQTGKVWGSEEAFRLYGIERLTEYLPLDLVESFIVENERVNQALVDLITQQKPYDIEFKIKPGDRENPRVLHSTAELVFDEHGDPEKVVGVIQDITESKEKEEENNQLLIQLQQSQKLESIGRLAGGVAHDFNNMLGVILGNIELSLDQLDPASPIIPDLEEAQDAAARSAGLTQQLLAFARKQTVSPKVIQLNEVLEGMLNMLGRLMGENIKLIWNPGASIGPVKMDPTQVDQILTNLCVNARDAIGEVGTVTIETAQATFDEDYCSTNMGYLPGRYVMLKVSDTGSGMDEITRQKLFEPFFTTKSTGKGTGLGLAMVYGAVKQNNGFIKVDSEEGVGSSFAVYLPIHADHATKTEIERDRKSVPQGDESILLVEDEEQVLRLTKRILEKLGYSVVTANSPEKALQVESTGIQMLVSDIIMPDMNGFELANKLKEKHPDLQCLFMSGYTAEVIGESGVLEDGTIIIKKPFTADEIGNAVRQILDKTE